jgi:AcrR family transcriptional regulator
VATVIQTARVSRSRFYELFSGSEACVAALLEELVGYVEHHLRQRHIDDLPWDERVRQGLWVILCCLEHEPLLARVYVLHSVGVAGVTAERREQIIAALVAQVDAGREICSNDLASPMAAEGVVGAAMRLIYSQLAHGEGSSAVTDLFAELTGLILLPYLGSAQIREIQQRPAPDPLPAGQSSRLAAELEGHPEGADPLNGIAIRLTPRTALVLQAISRQPGASNRAVANEAGIADPGQASKLLARLERLGLISNQSVTDTKWELNSWTLTPAGSKMVALLATRVMFSDLSAPRSVVPPEGA